MKEKKNSRSYVKTPRSFGRWRRKNSRIFASPKKGKFWYKMKKLIGIGILFLGGFLFVCLEIQETFSYQHMLCLLIAIAGMMVCRSGSQDQKRMNRFRYYCSFLEERDYIHLYDMAQITGRTMRFLQKDLWNMLDKKLFLQGRMNEQGTCLFLTRDAYERYIRGELIPQPENQPEEEWEDIPQEREKDWTKEDWVEEPEEDAEAEKMETVEEESPGEVLEGQLYELEVLLRQIQQPVIRAAAADICVRGKQLLFYQDTMQWEDICQFLTYYFPVTARLLHACAELEKEQLEEQMGDLPGIMHTIQYSFDTFVEKLLEGKKMDVQGDIVTMEEMLERFQ